LITINPGKNPNKLLENPPGFSAVKPANSSRHQPTVTNNPLDQTGGTLEDHSARR